MQQKDVVGMAKGKPNFNELNIKITWLQSLMGEIGADLIALAKTYTQNSLQKIMVYRVSHSPSISLKLHIHLVANNNLRLN